MTNLTKFGTKVVVAAALMSSAAFGQGAFMGFHGGFNQSKMKLSGDLGEILDNPKDSAFELGLKGGYDFDSFRVWGGYAYQSKANEKQTFENASGSIDVELDWTSHNFLVGVDYTPSITDSFKAVVGAYGGLSLIKANLNADGQITVGGSTYIFEGSGSETGTGALVGLRLGGIYAINNNNEIEFGIKGEYAKTGIEGLDNAVNYGAYIGYNYKF